MTAMEIVVELERIGRVDLADELRAVMREAHGLLADQTRRMEAVGAEYDHLLDRILLGVTLMSTPKGRSGAVWRGEA